MSNNKNKSALRVLRNWIELTPKGQRFRVTHRIKKRQAQTKRKTQNNINKSVLMKTLELYVNPKAIYLNPRLGRGVYNLEPNPMYRGNRKFPVPRRIMPSKWNN